MPVIPKKNKEIRPARNIVLSFLIVILVGTFLLTLPISSKSGSFTPVQHAFFTATSATCVTGLVIYDTFQHWTYFGQFVILLMIQIGGLGLVTFVTFFNFAIGKKLGLRRMQVASEAVNYDSFTDAGRLIRIIIKFSLIVEAIGALILMTVFIPKMGARGIFTSIFIAVSAFCNAGFDILGKTKAFTSLTEFYNNPIVLITVMLLIILGGVGFLVWFDIRQYKKKKHLELHSKVVLLVTGILIVLGTVMFCVCEWNNPLTMKGFTVPQKLLNGAFQSVTCRTAGFNTFDMASMNPLTKIFSIILMFIGAAPGSTGGGIKVTTITVVIMAVIGVLRNKEETIILKRRVDKSIVYKAITILMLSITTIFISTVVIYGSISSRVEIAGIDTIFEVVSAFATVGLSSGITGVTTLFAELIFCIVMFLGRVGPISVILSLASVNVDKSKKQVVPEGKIMVG